MTDQPARDRLDRLIADALAGLPIEQQLTAILEQLMERIDADPELRRETMRQAIRSAMFSRFWRW